MLTDITDLSHFLTIMPNNLSKIEQARFLYIQLGKVSYFNPLYKYMSDYNQIEYFNMGSSFQNPNFVICNSLTEQYNYLLKRCGIKTRVEKTQINPAFGTYHPVLFFEDENEVEHETDLVYDLPRIQAGSKTTHFAKASLSTDTLKDIDFAINYITNKKDYTDSYWKVLIDDIKKLDITSSEKLELLLKVSNKIIDFSLLGPDEQAQTYMFLLKKSICSDNIKFNRVLNPNKKREEYYFSCLEPDSNSKGATKYYLYDYCKSEYTLADQKSLNDMGLFNNSEIIVR